MKIVIYMLYLDYTILVCTCSWCSCYFGLNFQVFSVLIWFVDIRQKRVIDHRDLNLIAAEEKRKMEEKNRVKTAPARERRRNWLAGSVNIKTERGERCRLKAPGNHWCRECLSSSWWRECLYSRSILYFLKCFKLQEVLVSLRSIFKYWISLQITYKLK